MRTILRRLLALPDAITRSAVPQQRQSRAPHDLTFTQLNDGWNADPNGSRIDIRLERDTLIARFPPNAYQFTEYEGVPRITLRFQGCARFRVTPLNDHGFALGQCRFSGMAPAWGAFYEITGNTRDAEEPTPWQNAEGRGTRHFHFYQRDGALEVKADGWSKDP